MNELKTFEHPEFGTIRTMEVDGEPWLVGKDVATVLGYSNPSKALIDHVDDEDKLNNETLSSLGQRGGWLINESGLYSLVLSSKLPGAKKFRRWVTAEVLPTIRRHGVYATPDMLEKMIASPEFGIKLLTTLQQEREARQALEAEVEQAKPKILFADAVSISKSSILIGELAKVLKQNGIETGQNRLFAWMRDNGYLIRRQGTDFNMPTQRAMELGLFRIKETVITHADGHTSISKTVKVTGKGQQHFVNIFLNRS